MKTKLLLGLAPTRRNVFSKEASLDQKKQIEKKLAGLNVSFVNIDEINEEGLLYSSQDAQKASKSFIQKRVDAVFVPHVNFGTEAAVAELCKNVNKPVLLWGPRDEAPGADGIRFRDTQCGLFATSKVLQR